MAENAKNIGALEFEVLLKNNDIQKQAEQTKNIIQDIAKSAEKVSTAIDNVGKSTSESVKTAGKEVDKLEGSLEELSNTDVSINLDGLSESLNKIKKTETDALATLDEFFNNNKADIAELERELKTLADNNEAVNSIKEEISERKKLQEEILAQKKVIQSASTEGQITAITGALKKMREAGEESTDAFKSLENELTRLKGTREVFEDSEESVEEYTDAIAEAVLGNSEFGSSMLSLAKSGKGIKGIFDAMKVGAQAFGKALMGLMANPAFLAIAGLSGAGMAVKWWFDYNKGVEQATRLTKQLTDLSGSDLKNFRSEVQAVADTFGKEFDEVLLATNALSKQMGISVQDAMKAVKDGFVLGADANGEFLDTLREYPAYFKEAGLSAKQFVAITATGVKEGVFSDKAVDAIKEANLRLREMPTATAQAIDGIGLSSEAMMKALKDGEKTTFDLMQEISKRMSELPESASEVGTAIADIWGGPGEDAGLQFLTTIQYITDDLDKMKQESDEIISLQDQLLNSNIAVEQAVAEVFDSTDGFFETLTTNAKILLNDVIINLLGYLSDIKREITETWNENENLRKSVGVIINYAGNLFSMTMKGVKAVIKSIVEVGNALADLSRGDFENMGNHLGSLADAWVDYGKQIGKTFSDLFTGEGAEKFNKKIEELKAQAKKSEEESGGGNGEDKPTKKLADILKERKKLYEEYAAGVNSTDEKIRDFAQKNAKELLKSGATWEEYLNNIREKYKGNASAIKQINEELLAISTRSMMDIFKDSYSVANESARTLAEQLEAIRQTRAQISDNDPLKSEKNKYLDEELRNIGRASTSDLIASKNEYKDYLDERLRESEKYARLISDIEIQYAKATSDEEKKILESQMNAAATRYNLAIGKERIQDAQQLADKLVEIETDKEKRIEEIQKDESLSSVAREELISAVKKNAQNDIAIARNEFSEVDDEFVNVLLGEMQGVMSKQMDYYVSEIQRLQTALKNLDPNSEEYIKLNAQLNALQKGYENLKNKSTSETKKMAKDKNVEKIKGYLIEFSDQLKNIGSEIGGVSGDVISATGEIMTGVVGICDSVKKYAEINTQAIEGVSQAGVTAIKAVEKASVILAIIGTIMQIINAVQNLSKNDERRQLQNDIDALSQSLRDAKEAAEISDLRNSKTSLFGDDAWGRMITNINVAKKAYDDYSKAQKKIIGETQLGVGSISNELLKHIIDTSKWTADTYVANMQVKTKDATNGFFGIGGSSAKYESLRTIAPDLFDSRGKLSMPALSEFKNSDLFNKLSGENQNLINNLVKQWEDYNTAIEEVKNNFKDMFSDIGSGLMDSFVDMFEGAEGAMEDFENTWDSMIENMIKSMLFSKMIAPEIDKLTEKLQKDGFFDDPEANLNKAISTLGEAKKNIYGAKDGIFKALESFSDLGEQSGLNLFAKQTEEEAVTDKKTLSGAIKGASQESIDLLAGQTNAVRINQVEQIEILRQQYSGLTTINTSIIRNGVILTQILDAVKNSQSNLRSQGLDI